MQCAVYLRQGGYKPQTGDHQLCHWGLQPHKLANVINTEAMNSLAVQTWLDKPGASVSRVEWTHPLILAAQKVANPPWYSV